MHISDFVISSRSAPTYSIYLLGSTAISHLPSNVSGDIGNIVTKP